MHDLFDENGGWSQEARKCARAASFAGVGAWAVMVLVGLVIGMGVGLFWTPAFLAASFKAVWMSAAVGLPLAACVWIVVFVVGMLDLGY